MPKKLIEFVQNSAGPDVLLAAEQAHASIGLYLWALGLKLDEQAKAAVIAAARAGARGVELDISTTLNVKPVP